MPAARRRQSGLWTVTSGSYRSSSQRVVAWGSSSRDSNGTHTGVGWKRRMRRCTSESGRGCQKEEGNLAGHWQICTHWQWQSRSSNMKMHCQWQCSQDQSPVDSISRMISESLWTELSLRVGILMSLVTQ